jgi:histidinol-phosphate aminotransferase
MMKLDCMSDFDQLVPAHIRALGAYIAGKSPKQAELESGVRCIKLASNENPFGPSPRALAAMQAALNDSNFYPDSDSGDLRQALAARHGLQPDQILVTAGSTAFLNVLARTLLAPGLNAVTSALSFVQYSIVTRATGATLIEVPLRDFAYDLDAIAAAINPATRLVFLANPNNPTGTMFPATALDRFLDRMPPHVVVVIDEAYYDFADYFARQRGVEYSHSLDYVSGGRKVAVLRTFSKAQGLAGLRVGYGMAPAELIAYCARMQITFSLSTLAQAAAAAAMEDAAHLQRTLDNNAKGTGWLTKELSALGVKPVPTWANFLYLDVGEDGVDVAKRLQSAGVIVRPLRGWGAPLAIRVSIGTPEQNEIFLRAFQSVMRPTVPR